MDWTQLDWTALDRLREGFLSGGAASGPYWQSTSDLASYDLTYGERIGWKWDAVLNELHLRGWTPPAGPLLDWGCGSGIAGRRVLRAFSQKHFTSFQVWDHSMLACDFALQAAQKAFPGLDTGRFLPGPAFSGTLVVSHVLNELPTQAQGELLTLARQASAIIWVEPGTHAVSRELAVFREKLLDAFTVIAPCTHAATCGLLMAGNERHWCHFFAPPPSGIYADSDWVKFGQRAGVDLRSLPYSFLVLEKKTPDTAPALPPGSGRLIGRSRHHKAHAEFLGCDQHGLVELALMKRTDPVFFKKLGRNPGIPLYRWEHDDGRIRKIEKIVRETNEPGA
jgi:hypothetical protein